MSATITRQDVEQIALATIPHNFAQWENTGGGIYTLTFHTMRDHYQAGPRIAVGPFSPDGRMDALALNIGYDEGDDNPTECSTREAHRPRAAPPLRSLRMVQRGGLPVVRLDREPMGPRRLHRRRRTLLIGNSRR